MKKEIFVFDFDNTLLPTDELIYLSFNEVYKSFKGKDITIEELVKYYGPTEEGMFKNILGEKDYKEAFQEYLLLYEKYHQKFFSSLDSAFLETFKKIKAKNKKIIILTGRSEESLLISLKLLDLTKYIDGYYFGSIFKANKDDSFNKLMKDFKVSNKELVYFGDTLSDVNFCNKLGIDIVSCLYYQKYDIEKVKVSNPNFILNIKDISFVIDKYL